MADIYTQYTESNTLFDAQNNKNQLENTQVPEQNQEVLSQKDANSLQSQKVVSEKLNRNDQQPNQDEVQSAKSKVASESPKLIVVDESSQIETVRDSPRFKSAENSPQNKIIREVEISKESSKTQNVTEPAVSNVSGEENVISDEGKANSSVKVSKEPITYEELINLRNKVDRVLSQSIVHTHLSKPKHTEAPLRSYNESSFSSVNVAHSNTNPYAKPSTALLENNLYSTQFTRVNHYGDLYQSEQSRTSYHGYSSNPKTLEFKPNYDKQKLDAIISRVMSTKSVINAIKPANMYSSDIHISTNLRRETPLQSQPNKSISATKNVTKDSEVPKRTYCGTIEDDVESVVMPHAEESSQIYDEEDVEKSRDKIQEKPKEHRTPKRLEIINARKQRLGSSVVQTQSDSKNNEKTQFVTKSQTNDQETSSENYQKTNKNLLLTSPKKISVSHHRQHGRQNSLGWSATTLESPCRPRTSAQKY